MSSSVSELLIIDGDVLDGSGAPAERADVLVRNGLIAAVGSDLARSLPGHAPMTTIDAAGLVISPGFVDIHTHSDPVPLMDAPQPFKLLQGVTTEVIGNCGSSHGGLREDALSDLGITDALRGHTSAGLFATYLDLMAEVGPTNHIATLVGHTTLRERANGHGRSLEPGALEKMSDLIEVAFDAGALGLSSGLEYPPGSYADVDEMTALAKVAARWGRPYVTHVRNESEYVVGAIEEAIEVARRSGVQLQISHCKASGPAVHGFAPNILEMINSARTEGIDVAGDVYPYAACSTPASALLPPAILQEGRAAMLRDLSDPQARRRWRRVAEDAAQPVGAGIWRETLPDVVRFVMHRESAYVNRTLAELSGDRDPWETLCSLIVRDPDCFTVLATMTDEDVRTFVSGPDMIIASDSVWPLDHGYFRIWGTFPHFLGHYVRDLGLVSLPDAIRKITSVPARRFGLERGTLAPGAVADITVFDPRTIAHDPDPLRPNNQPSGIQHVLLAGAAVIVNGEFSGGRHGSVLRRPGSSVGSRAAR